MIDWYYDKLPGNAFALALHQLRAKGEVVRASALGGAMPIYYILSYQALTEAFRDGEHFPPGHAYQIISLPFIGETFMSMDEERHREWRPPMTPAFRRHAINARRQDPRDDQISRWLNTSIAGKEISEAAILAHIRLFFTAGATTTSDAMSNLFHALLTHPDAWERCVAEPQIQPQAIQELLRWNPPVAAQPRFTRPNAPVVLAGVEIPANTAVLFGIAAANRDPEVFTDPDRFDISRNSRTLLTFGPGLRTCPGMHLAQKNLETALRIVAERFPTLRLDQHSASLPEGILLRGTASLPVSWR